jgi:Uma2 family endonuclease
MTLDEFLAGDYAEGYQYELIKGKLYVSPQRNLPQNRVEEWLHFQLKLYARDHPEVLNYVTAKGRVFIPNHEEPTCPEPDVAAYRQFPLHLPMESVRWQDVSPILVAEVLSPEDPDKDAVRNAALYFQVPSIKEYWLLDNRDDAARPSLRVHRRHGGKWRVLELNGGDKYTTRLLPGFELILDIQSLH